MQQQEREAMTQQSPRLSAVEPNLSGNLPPGFDSSLCRSVYVGNIHPQVTEPLLQEVFGSAGLLKGCELIRKEKSSYGFVDYFDRRCAALAITALNGRHLFGKHIKVNWAYASSQIEDTSDHFNIFVGDLSPEVTDATLFTFFSVYPSCLDARVMWDQKTGRSRGFGFVSFLKQQDAQSAINELTGKLLGSRQIRCNWAAKGATSNEDKQSSDSEDGQDRTDDDAPENSLQYTTVYVGNLAPEIMAANQTQIFSLRSILEKDKLNETNFLDWDRNLRIVLKHERKEYVLDQPLPLEPTGSATRVARDAFTKHTTDATDVGCIMLSYMEDDLQKHFMHLASDAYAMMGQLREMFQESASAEMFKTYQALNTCKMTYGESVSHHVLRMKGYSEHLARLGLEIPKKLVTNIILSSLPSMYNEFIMNFKMHNMDKTISELHGMLKSAEAILKGKTKEVLKVKGASDAYAMMGQLREMFQECVSTEMFKTYQALNTCKMTYGESVSHHVLRMKGYSEHLARLGFEIPKDLLTNLILSSLPSTYNEFIMIFKMNNMDKTISELHMMLKTAEAILKGKTKEVLRVKGANFKKARGSKGKNDAICFFCQEAGHWKKDCKKFRDE